MADKRTLWDKTWKDKTGQVMLWQRPNWLLITWAVCWLATKILVVHGLAHRLVGGLGTAALMVWAVGEIGWGINYYRRSLGFIVLFAALLSIIKGLV